MAIHQRRRQQNFITVGEGENRTRMAVDYMDGVDRAVQEVDEAWGAGVRPMKWPEKEMKALESVEKGHRQYPYSLLLWGYYALDLGMVEEAMKRFSALARVPSGKGEFALACGEVAFVLAGFYGEREAAKGWWELYLNRASSVDLALGWRVRGVLEEEPGARGLVEGLAASGGAGSGLGAEVEWLAKVESGEWEEEWDQGLSVFEKGRILQAPFY